MKILGIDESGRGPVIGPLVITGAMTNEEGILKLKAIGVKDSKLIAPKKREMLAKQIEKICTLKTIISQPKEIDEALLSPNLNLNKLELINIAMIINDLKPDKVIIDCPSTNIKAFVEELKLFLKNKNIIIIAEHKADQNFVECGSASIIAKVTRDNEIEKIKKKIGIDFGSGYPSDPKVVQFLKKHWKDYPEIIRKTWATYKKLKKDNETKNLDNF